ncbi:MAG: glucose-6-phosphate isomerase [Hungatella sp.]|nr:glucose-6-phosphate isomerase [Hungatella sp.]
MGFYPGLEIKSTRDPIGFVYGEHTFGPKAEVRRLADIRNSLEDRGCEGPEELYAIVMDVGETEDRSHMEKRNLLFGAVTYSAGVMGREPVRSQGHIHSVSLSCGWSTPEVYEIWEGRGIIYMQQSGEDDPGLCYAVHAKEGDVVIVPPGWVHATINGDVGRNMTFGAWCVRDYGFEYEQVRRHNGIAYFPRAEGNNISWHPNPSYHGGRFVEKEARTYEDFGLKPGVPIYTQFKEDKDLFLFVSRPGDYPELWRGYRP